jgi:hypothetical protein
LTNPIWQKRSINIQEKNSIGFFTQKKWIPAVHRSDNYSYDVLKSCQSVSTLTLRILRFIIVSDDLKRGYYAHFIYAQNALQPAKAMTQTATRKFKMK